MLSGCIFSKMREISSIDSSSEALSIEIKSGLNELQYLTHYFVMSREYK